VAQLRALVEEPGMLFALEQPRHNALSDLPEVTAIIEEQPTWTKHEVDQCAYGRGEKKPSIVMTNYH
jgi:hypothetical protein